MSEQETSRSEGSSSSSDSQGEGATQETPQAQCIPVLATSSDSGMGNIIFSSPEKCESEADDQDKESNVCDSEQAKDTSSGDRESVSCTRETLEFNHKQSKSCEDNITSTEGLNEHFNVFKEKGNEDLQEKPPDTERSEADHCPNSSVDEGIELHDSSDALENSSEEDNENILAKHCDIVCGSDGNGTSAAGKNKDAECICKSSDTCGTLKSSDVLETHELEVSLPEKGEGVDVLLKSIDKEQHNPDLNKGISSDLPQSYYQSVAKDSSSASNLCTEGASTPGAGISDVGVGSCSLFMVNNINTESCIPSQESCNMGVQGCSVTAESCYSSGDNLVCARDPIRDTDSEAGDSVCSEDHEHEACRGENGCVHRVAGDALDHNWEFAVDEEFNVPRKPIFNGSVDQLDRRSSLKRKASEEPEESKPAKCKRGIQFEGVTVFYFPRSQGFTCVPSQGGSSLGMSRRHSHIRQFSLAEHAVEQRRAHREYLMRLRQQRSAREYGESSSRGSSSEDSEENSEEASDLSDSELDADSYYFLQPLPIRQRRALLRQAGICHIEGLEKEECKDIRISREMCGCQCKVYCDPDTCQCAQAGIKCQVDRHNFPCGCSREGCGNSYGRIEFNPIRVRTHFIHTLMRLEIEKRQTQQQQHHRHQQEQEWEQHHQQRRAKWAKWVAATSIPPNGFTGNSGGLGGGNLPFFEGSQDSGGLSVVDVNKYNSSVEMGACVGSMNTPLYQHFESRQMLGPGGPSVYIQHDSVGDYNSGTCSVFGGLGATFDPSGAYGSCHSFPSGSVVPPQPQVGPQVASQPVPPEAYNSLSKFSNSTTSLVSASFPYSGDVSSAATATVNCSYPQNNFCMTAVHDNTNGTVFGQYHETSTVTQNLFKASVNECGDFQPNFEALSSSASTDKAGRYIPAPSLAGQGKEMCGVQFTTTQAVVSNQCSGVVNENYKAMGAGSSTVSWSSSPHQTSEDTTEIRHPQLPVSLAPPLTPSYDHTTPGKDTPSNEDSTDAVENLGEIVKKSMVETVSA